MATHSSILAWRIPWTKEPGRLYSPWGHKESDTTKWLTLSPHFLFISEFTSMILHKLPKLPTNYPKTSHGIQLQPKSREVAPFTYISLIIKGMWKNKLNKPLLACVIVVQVSIVNVKGWSNYLDNSGRTYQASETPLSFCLFCLSNQGITSILSLLTYFWSYYIFGH